MFFSIYGKNKNTITPLAELGYCQFTGSAREDITKARSSYVGELYDQFPSQRELNWGTLRVGFTTPNNLFMFIEKDTHFGQDWIHSLIGDKSFQMTDWPGIYVGTSFVTFSSN